MDITLINEDFAQNEITMQNENSVKNEDFNFSDEKLSGIGKFITLILNFLNCYNILIVENLI